MGKLIKYGVTYCGNVTINDTASNVAYDNTESNLSATNVQAAIDEVNGKLYKDVVVSYNNIYITDVSTNAVRVGNKVIIQGMIQVTQTIPDQKGTFCIYKDGVQATTTTRCDFSLLPLTGAPSISYNLVSNETAWFLKNGYDIPAGYYIINGIFE